MKRAISLLLAAALTLSLCSCGKSSAVKDAEALIDSIGEVTLDSEDAINAASDAYTALSEKEQQKVENYSVLESSVEQLTELKYEEEYPALVDRLLQLTSACDTVGTYNYCILYNLSTPYSQYGVSTDYVNLDFVLAVISCFNNEDWGFEDYVTALESSDTDLESSSEMVMTINGEGEHEYHMQTAEEVAAESVKSMLWAVALGISPDALVFVQDYPLGVDEEHYDDLLSMCYDFNEQYAYISDNASSVFDDVSEFTKTYADLHPDEIDVLSDLNDNISVYVDLVLNPSGDADSYYEESYKYIDQINYDLTICNATD